jgi:hypothetical protein
MTSRLANLLGPVLRATTLVALLAAVGAGAVNAHPGGPEEIIVVGDHVDPGQAFQVLAAFIEPGVDVPITVVTGSTVFDLGSVSVDAAGRFNASLTLPSDVPHGYAELHLAQPNEGDAATVFLVGPRDGSTPAAPAVPGGSVFDSQAGALILFIGTLMGIAVIGFLLIRGGRKPTT